MDQGSYYRIQDSGNGKNNRHKVKPHRKTEVTLDRNHHTLGKCNKMWQFFNLIIYQYNICRIYGNVASYTAHGNSYIGFFQCRSVVDPITDHTYLFFISLVTVNPVQFVFRQAACMNFLNIQLIFNRSGCIFMVSCKKYRLYAQTVQLIDHDCTFFSDRIGQCQKTCQLAIQYHINQCTSLFQIFLNLSFYSSRNICTIFTNHFCISRKHFSFLCLTGDTTPRYHAEIFRRKNFFFYFLFITVYNCFSQRML